MPPGVRPCAYPRRRRAVTSTLFQAIPERQSTRTEYDGKPFTRQELELLEKAGTKSGVRFILLTEQAAVEKILEYVVQGKAMQCNATQMNDCAFVEELKNVDWSNGDGAVQTGDGLYLASSGNPSLPPWLENLLFDFFFTPCYLKIEFKNIEICWISSTQRLCSIK